jgi:hypothetical protein
MYNLCDGAIWNLLPTFHWHSPDLIFIFVFVYLFLFVRTFLLVILL